MTVVLSEFWLVIFKLLLFFKSSLCVLKSANNTLKYYIVIEPSRTATRLLTTLELTRTALQPSQNQGPRPRPPLDLLEQRCFNWITGWG